MQVWKGKTWCILPVPGPRELKPRHVPEIITGSFVNARYCKYIRAKKPETVSLVCMGYACEFPTDEDTLCAEYIRNELTGLPNDFAKW
jgi:phosphosulfolactate phosphohydrolase-like enzyme